MTKVELIQRASEGDRDAFDLLMTALIDHLFRIARLILRDTDRAEDAVQKALAWTESEPGSGWPLAFWIVGEVEAGTCGSDQAVAVGPGATEFIDALTNVAGYEMTEPAAARVGGFDGWQVGVGPGTCADDTLFSTATYRFAIAEGERFQIWALDVDGQLLVITSADFPGTTAFEESYRSPDPSLYAEHLAEVGSIIESITFEP